MLTRKRKSEEMAASVTDNMEQLHLKPSQELDENVELKNDSAHDMPVDEDQKYLTCHEVLQFARDQLTRYEKKEILQYPRVYCFGMTASKQFNGPHNRGFDSDTRSYCVVIRDHIGYRYEVLRQLGVGYSSKVYKAYDHKTKSVVALKIFRNDMSCRKLAENEEKLLRDLNRLGEDSTTSTNVIHFLDAFIFRKHHVIVLEMLATGLYSHIKGLAKSILRALLTLSMAKIIHGDIKPENLVLRDVNRTGVKLIDFGTSCRVNETVHTYYQTRYYRAPEIILGIPYGLPIDMWSFGCLVAELATGRPLFCGTNEFTLLAHIMEVLGLPPVEVQRQTHPSIFPNHFHENGLAKYWPCPNYIPDEEEDVCHGPPGSRTLRAALGDVGNDYFVDFLQRCLSWDPSVRMTPDQALNHPWLKVLVVNGRK